MAVQPTGLQSLNPTKGVTPTTANIFGARVMKAILDDQNPETKDAFKIFGEWSSIGCIFFNSLNQPNQNPEFNTNNFARPLFPNVSAVPLENEIGTLDYSGAHTGPQSYHYHLEPKAWSDDDDVLVGIISDGFFVYGRKCSLTGTYPTDLDASGGHTHTTDHSESDEYHYHVNNEAYLNQYYIIFPGDYQGTPNAIQ